MTSSQASRPWLLLLGLLVITAQSVLLLAQSPAFASLGNSAVADDLAELRHAWLRSYRDRGFPFESPNALANADPAIRRSLGREPSDPWGRGYRFVIERRDGDLIPVAVFSFGPDRTENTADDLVLLVPPSHGR